MNRFVFKNGGSINISSFIRRGALRGNLKTKIEISKESVKLDFYAQKYYDDPSLWWIIAAASGIGWWLQVPPGTVLYIPTSLKQIEELAERI